MTRTTCALLRITPAWFVAGSLARLTIFVLPSRERWAARRAMSSRSRSAGFTIGKCMTKVMSAPGGRGSISIRCRSHSNFGNTHGGLPNLLGLANRFGTQMAVKANRHLRFCSNLVMAAGCHDLVPPVRCQPAEWRAGVPDRKYRNVPHRAGPAAALPAAFSAGSISTARVAAASVLI